MFWPSLPEEPLTIHRFHGQTDFRSLGPECIKVIDTETILSILHEGGALLSRWKILKSPNQCKAHSPFSFPFGFNFPVCFSQCLPLYLCLLSHLWQIHVLELSSCWCLSFVENTRVMGTDHSIERCVGGWAAGDKLHQHSHNWVSEWLLFSGDIKERQRELRDRRGGTELRRDGWVGRRRCHYTDAYMTKANTARLGFKRNVYEKLIQAGAI